MPFLWPLILMFLVPFLLFTLFFQLSTFSLAKLGLSPMGATLLLLFSILGSMVNIPITRRRRRNLDEWTVHHSSAFPLLFYYRPPVVNEQVIAINVGGAVIPVLFSVYLLFRAPLIPVLIATAVITFVTHRLAKPVRGIGISLPVFIPPLLAAVVALLLARDHAAPVAYISGVLGTLIGADLLNLRQIRDIGGHVMSIGGAGVFDGIFLIGIIAAFLS